MPRLHTIRRPQIQLQKRKVLMLQQQQDGMKGTLGSTRATMGGIHSAREKAVGLHKQITILENRLEKQYIKYNEVRGECVGAAGAELVQGAAASEACCCIRGGHGRGWVVLGAAASELLGAAHACWGPLGETETRTKHEWVGAMQTCEDKQYHTRNQPEWPHTMLLCTRACAIAATRIAATGDHVQQAAAGTDRQPATRAHDV